MAGKRRMPREKATTALSALLETICAGGAHASCITAVYVFGSYARGALTVGDVDVDIEYDAKLDPAVDKELLDNLVVGRDWNTPFRKALNPSRALQVLFGRLEMIAEPMLIYRRVTHWPKHSRASRRSRPIPTRAARSAIPCIRRSSRSRTTSHGRQGSSSPSCSRRGCWASSSSTWLTRTRTSSPTETSSCKSVCDGVAPRVREPELHARRVRTCSPAVLTSGRSR